MPSQAEIVEAMQMSHFFAANPINEAGTTAFEITYQFETGVPADDWSGLTGWYAWTDDEKDAAREALAHLETFLNVDFVEVSGQADADLSLGLVDLPGPTAGYGGAWLSTWSDGSFNDFDAFAAYDATLDLTDNMNLLLHELGHALGLDHPFEGVALDPAYDSNHYTVMSYTSDPESGTKNEAMMLYDILALQDIWGAAEFNGGDTFYTGPRTDNVDVVWDTGGTDTFDASARDNDVILDLRHGRFSTFGAYEDLAIGYNLEIENAIGGTGNDTITGNGLANTLWGDQGDDLLTGYGGDDLLIGGGKKDKLKGGSGDDDLRGGGHNDKLYGGSGDDWLFGEKGVDKLFGDDGHDVFVFELKGGRDVVKDFENDIDALLIVDRGTREQVLGTASEKKGHTTFTFDDGDSIKVKNMTLAVLEDDLFVA